jgi:hypothetical protein
MYVNIDHAGSKVRASHVNRFVCAYAGRLILVGEYMSYAALANEHAPVSDAALKYDPRVM